MEKKQVISALKKTVSGIKKALPDLVGVLLLIGLVLQLDFGKVSGYFSGNQVIDTIFGASLGSIAAGNPITSYILGGELLDKGISLVAVTAFMLAWVTVGIVQLPGEILIMGRKFAIIRNSSSFLLAIVVSFAVVATLRALQ
jgi:uncharacterized membrane protein YraQ (UPF0718 family)